MDNLYANNVYFSFLKVLYVFKLCIYEDSILNFNSLKYLKGIYTFNNSKCIKTSFKFLKVILLNNIYE